MWLYWSAFAVVMLWTLGTSVAWALHASPSSPESVIAFVTLGIVCIVNAVALVTAGQRKLSGQADVRAVSNNQKPNSGDRSINGIPPNNEERQAEDRSDSEQKKTEKSISAATWMIATATVVNVVIAAEQWGTLDSTDQSIQTQTRIANRPWIGPSDDVVDPIRANPLTFDSEGNADTAFAVTSKNFSSAAAQNVWAWGRLLITIDLKLIDEIQMETCSDNYVGKPDIGYVVFPGKTQLTNTWGGHFEKNEIKNPAYNGTYEAWLIGCIGYRDQFRHLYKTKFAYWLADPTTHKAISFAPSPNSVINGKFMLWRTSIE